MFFEHQMYVREKLAEFAAPAKKAPTQRPKRERNVAAASSDLPDAQLKAHSSPSQQTATADG
jgi:hypothetical protein